LRLLASIPLALLVARNGGGLDWWLVIAAIVCGELISLRLFALGLVMPLLFAIGYAMDPQIANRSLPAFWVFVQYTDGMTKSWLAGVLLITAASLVIYLLLELIGHPTTTFSSVLTIVTVSSLAIAAYRQVRPDTILTVVFVIVLLALLSALASLVEETGTTDVPELVIPGAAGLFSSFSAALVGSDYIASLPIDDAARMGLFLLVPFFAVSILVPTAVISTTLHSVRVGRLGSPASPARVQQGNEFSIISSAAMTVAAVGLQLLAVVLLVTCAYIGVVTLWALVATPSPLILLLVAGWLVGTSLTPVSGWMLRFILGILLIPLIFGALAANVPLLVAFGIGVLSYYRFFPDLVVSALLSTLAAYIIPSILSPWRLFLIRLLPPHTSEFVPIHLPGHKLILADAFDVNSQLVGETLLGIRACPYADFASTANETIRLIILRELSRVHSASKLVRAVTPKYYYQSLLYSTRTADLLSNAHSKSYRAGLVPLANNQRSTDTNHPQRNMSRLVSAVMLEDSELSVVLPSLQDVASHVETALDERSSVLRTIQLEDSLRRLDLLQQRLAASRLPTRTLPRWRVVLVNWRQLIQDELEREKQRSSRSIVNPFQPGGPLLVTRTNLFKGRLQFAEEIVTKVDGPDHPTILLYGPRRCGKSSFLLNFSRLLPSDIAPVYVDLQNPALTQHEVDFCYGVAQAIARDLRSQGWEVPSTLPPKSSFSKRVYSTFQQWLTESLGSHKSAIRLRRLVICFDEFEKIKSAVDRGRMSRELLDQFRHLIQHWDALCFLLAGVQVLSDLGPDWSSYFINVYPMEMVYLEPDEARELLEQPDPGYNLQYADNVIDAALRETRCHPYLLQLLGEQMVKQANTHNVGVLTLPLLETAFEASLTSGSAYFENLWTEYTGATPAARAVSRSLLCCIARGDQITTSDADAQVALNRLRRYHVIEALDQGYSIEIPLVARWIRDRAEMLGD
jgi:hypothetical protein